MEYKEKVENIDFIFEKIENSEMFSIENIFFDSNIEYDDISDIISFGEKYDLFEKTGEWFMLTPKGEKLKEFKKGFEKFENKNKPKKYSPYKISSFILTLVLGCSTFYFARANYLLKVQESKIPSLILKVDSLKVELNLANSKLIEYKIKPLKDTLKTKKESY
ncbi:hypothetical protein [Polaribacter sp. 11A2H]|uniref:hypothetical protein n=1 Tax=Polaribacter sp. 11A2H TaxID=2687290 RepID=UPI0014081389|nr:hypothetical protein [Polaribacter sp. 11A2H]